MCLGAEYFFRCGAKEVVAVADDGVDFETGNVCRFGGLGALYGIDDGRLHNEWECFANMALPWRRRIMVGMRVRVVDGGCVHIVAIGV